MILRHARARIAVAGLAGLLALSPWTPAAAAGPPVRPEPNLVEAPCATGEITYSSGQFRPDHRDLVLEGWIEPCAELEEAAGFGVMRYYTTKAEPSFFRTGVSPAGPWASPLYPYDPLTPRTQFTFDFWWTSGDRLRALCVARSVEAPVACVAVELPDGDFARRFTTIPVDDPRITSVPVNLEESDDDNGNPACGNCV